MKTELPKRDKRKKELWKVEENNKQKIQEYYNKQDLEIQRVVKEEKTPIDIYMNATKIAKHFNISAIELNQIFLNLQWIEKKDKWYIATELGLNKGSEQRYDTKTKNKYVVWNNKITNDKELIQEIESLKTKNIKITDEEKKEKGDKYETYIANFFREQGYFVWEHGKEKGVKDSGVDLFVKKGNYIYFVQCKDWEKWKIDHNTVQAIQTKIRNFLKQEKGLRKLSNGYTQKILYVTSKKCLTAGAYKYIEENSDILEYQVIPIEA